MGDWFSDFSIYRLLWYFIIYSFLGWCLEVVFCSVDTGKFVNRGFLNGPLCPIYGFGGAAVTLLLGPIDNFFVLYVASVILCSLLELVGGFLLKKIFHTSWWDYSDEPLNIGGYICLKFSLLWGVACLVVVRFVHPVFLWLVDAVPFVLGVVLLCVLYAAIAADLIVTVVAVNNMNRELKEIDAVSKTLHLGSDALAETLGGTAIKVAGKIDDLDLKTKRQKLSEAISEQREKLSQSIAQSEFASRFNQLMEKQAPVRDRLMRAFPDMKNNRYAAAFELMRGKREERKAMQKVTKSDDLASTPDLEETGED